MAKIIHISDTHLQSCNESFIKVLKENRDNFTKDHYVNIFKTIRDRDFYFNNKEFLSTFLEMIYQKEHPTHIFFTGDVGYLYHKKGLEPFEEANLREATEVFKEFKNSHPDVTIHMCCGNHDDDRTLNYLQGVIESGTEILLEGTNFRLEHEPSKDVINHFLDNPEIYGRMVQQKPEQFKEVILEPHHIILSGHIHTPKASKDLIRDGVLTAPAQVNIGSACFSVLPNIDDCKEFGSEAFGKIADFNTNFAAYYNTYEFNKNTNSWIMNEYHIEGEELRDLIEISKASQEKGKSELANLLKNFLEEILPTLTQEEIDAINKTGTSAFRRTVYEIKPISETILPINCKDSNDGLASASW